MNFYTTDDLNNIVYCRTYLCNMSNYIILKSDRKTKKTDFLIEYAIKKCIKKPNINILILVAHEHEKNRLYEKLINNSSFNHKGYNKTSNCIYALNGSNIKITSLKPEIYRGYNYDMVLVDDASDVFNTYDRITKFNKNYKYITTKIIMNSVYDVRNISDEFKTFNIDKKSAIGLYRRIKIDKIRNNIKSIV